MRKPAGKRERRKYRALIGVILVVVVGPARKKASDHGRTDQLEDHNIILNSKLILASHDYWNKIKPHQMNLQTIGFQNLLELTQDLVVVLKDHEFSFSYIYEYIYDGKQEATQPSEESMIFQHNNKVLGQF